MASPASDKLIWRSSKIGCYKLSQPFVDFVSCRVIEAEFHYFREDQLTILPDSECVLHPVFYRKLDPHKAYAPRGFPISRSPEFAEVSGR